MKVKIAMSIMPPFPDDPGQDDLSQLPTTRHPSIPITPPAADDLDQDDLSQLPTTRHPSISITPPAPAAPNDLDQLPTMPYPVIPILNDSLQRPSTRYPKRSVVLIASGLLAAMVLSLLVFVLGPWHTTPTKTNQSKPITHVISPTATSQPTAKPTLQPTPTLQNQSLADQVDSLFTSLVAQQSFSGSVLIARNGQVLLQKGYSMADWDQQIPNNAQTHFFLGSVTKEFTATAILLLQEQGKLDVQKSVCTYIDPCPKYWQSVTVHDVLTHTSGIPENSNMPLSNASPSAWIYSFNAYALTFTPGSQFSYCSVCYQILAYVVEQAAGEAYAQFLQQNIFTPLHMQSTSFNSQAFYAQPNHATGYAGWQTPAITLGWDDVDMTDPWSFLFGSGVLTTTVGDLYLWDQGLDAHKILSQHSLDQAYTAFSPTSLFGGSGYGYGWFIGKSPIAGHRLIWHDGVIDGFRTYIGRYIDDNVTVIFLSNLASTDSLSIAHSVEQLVFSS
jgi:CubicO group peptidase (beta-lactamase class C family)